MWTREGHGTHSNVVIQVKIPTHIVKIHNKITVTDQSQCHGVGNCFFLSVKCDYLTTLPVAETVQRRELGEMKNVYSLVKVQWLLYVPPGLTLRNSVFCPHIVFVFYMGLEQTDFFRVQQ